MHQITAYGNGPVPFDQAVLQSPGFVPAPGNWQAEQTYEDLLNRANVSSLQELWQLPSEDLINASLGQIFASPYSLFTYGPVVDSLFAPALPGHLLLQGSFAKDVKAMVSYCSNEGLLFVNPSQLSPAGYVGVLQSIFPDISSGALDYVSSALYPPIFDGSYGYTDEIGRQAATIADMGLICNTKFLRLAFGNQTYACKHPLILLPSFLLPSLSTFPLPPRPFNITNSAPHTNHPSPASTAPTSPTSLPTALPPA
jgi:carboxylesterase type B